MNGFERIMAALEGRQPDRVPIMLHNFMMAAREAGVTMAQFRQNARTIADCFIRAHEKYGYDGILVDIDTVTLAGAVGVIVDFPENEPARFRAPRFTRIEEVDDLKTVDIRSNRGVQIWLEAVSLLKAHFGDEVAIRGNCDQCPFSLAGLMRGPIEWMTDLLDETNRSRVDRLLEYCRGITEQFIALMVERGAHMVSNGDSPAAPDMISPAMYREFAQPYEKQIARFARKLGAPYILHICGDTTSILADMADTDASAIELDSKTDASRAREVLAGRAAFFGNIDPVHVLAQGSVRLVEEKTRELLRIFADSPRFVLNAGCAIPPETPPANIAAMIRAAREF